ncbi:MAG: hypothetical protein LBR13_01240 [Dysgonamonadaceae bacterium]|nr:hypothetical protein [Dysgonamonadaceae bacterium]
MKKLTKWYQAGKRRRYVGEKVCRKIQNYAFRIFTRMEKYGRGAGPMRNTTIIENADVVFAFPTEDSKGTRDSIRKARELKKILYVIEV